MERTTTIKLKESVKRRIGRLKSHPKESYNDVIERLVRSVEISRKNPEFSVWEVFEILEADERTKNGKGYTEHEAKKILGL